MRFSPCAALSIFALAALSAPPAARAALLASESFAYPPGLLSTQSGGTGWSAGWLTGQPNVFVVQAANLGGGLASGGGSLYFDGTKASAGTGARIFRPFDLNAGSPAALAGVVENTMTQYHGVQLAIGTPGTTVWLGVAFNGGTAGNGLPGTQYLDQVHLYNGPTTSGTALLLGDNNKDGEALAIGRGNTNTTWNFERTCGHDLCPNGATSATNYVSTVAMDNTTRWLVMRFAFLSTATTQITTWLDPAPGAVDPSNASAVLMNGTAVVSVTGVHFNWIELGGQTATFAFDEVRLATTFADLSTNGTAGVDGAGAAPALQLLAGPNPFASGATVRFVLPASGPAEVRVVDVAGRRVRRLQVEPLTAGPHTVAWDGRADDGTRAPAGLYLVRVRTAGGERTARLVRLP